MQMQIVQRKNCSWGCVLISRMLLDSGCTVMFFERSALAKATSTPGFIFVVYTEMYIVSTILLRISTLCVSCVK